LTRDDSIDAEVVLVLRKELATELFMAALMAAPHYALRAGVLFK
jgi:hypothetical protein